MVGLTVEEYLRNLPLKLIAVEKRPYVSTFNDCCENKNFSIKVENTAG
jgi:hypothetical protein